MTDLPDLQRMLDRQLELQQRSFGVDPPSLEGEDLVEFIRWNVLALTDELHEALGEVKWKPWTSDSGWVNRDAFVKELIDALHFWMNLVLAAGGSSVEITDRYFAKAAVNQARQESGYTHLYKKGADGRALDEPSI